MGITSVRLAEDIDKPLELLAEQLDRSKNYLINQAVKEYLVKRSLDDERWQDTLDALESLKMGKLIPEDQVSAWLSTWGTQSRKDAPKVCK